MCGNTTTLEQELAQSGARIIDLDWQVDLGAARATVDGIDPTIALCGNFDPVAVVYEGTPDDVRRGVEACRAAGGATWLAMPGCEVPRGTAAENMLALRDALVVQ